MFTFAFDFVLDSVSCHSMEMENGSTLIYFKGAIINDLGYYIEGTYEYFINKMDVDEVFSF